MQSQSERHVTPASVPDPDGVEIINRLPRRRGERHHASIADGCWLLVERLTDPKRQLARSAVLVYAPARRHAIPIGIIGDTALHSQRRERCAVEKDSFLKI